MAAPDLDRGVESTLLGRVFRGVLGVIGRHPVKLSLVALLFGAAPSVLIDLAHVWLGLPATGIGVLAIDGAAKVVPYSTLWSAVALILWYDAEGTRADFGDLLRWAVVSIPRVALTGAVFGLAVALGGVLVVPGLLALLVWSVAVPVSTLEGLWPLSALERSGELTKTYRAKIFGIILAYRIPLLLFAYAGERVIHGPGPATGLYDWRLIAFRAADAFVAEPFTALMATALYVELRRLQDGLLPGEADVFD